MSTALEQAIRFKVEDLNSLRRQLSDATRLGVSDASDNLEKVLAKGLSAGMKQSVDKVRAALREAQQRVDASTAQARAEMSNIQHEIQAQSRAEIEAQDEASRAAAKSAKEELQQKLKDQRTLLQELQKRERAEFDKISRKEIKQIENQGKRLEEIAEKAGEDLLGTDKIKKFGEAFAEILEESLDPSIQSLTKKLLEGVSKGGDMLSSYATKRMREEGGGGKFLQILAQMGPALAGIVAAVGAIAAVFNAAYEQTLEFNRAVLDGSSGIDLMGNAAFDGSKSLSNSLKEVREAALDVGYAMRVPAEEVIKTITAFNEAGLTFDELVKSVKGAGTATQAYAQFAEMSIIASQTLGTSVSEISNATNIMMRDFGMNLGQIEGSFAMIGFAAARSGMNVKDFFTSVNEASSGMALYNVKLSESAGLLIGLTDLLGEERGKQLSQEKGKFKGTGYQERYKSVMVAGQAATPIFQANFERQLSAFNETFGSQIEKSGEGIGKILGKYTTGGTLDPKKLAGLKGFDLGEVQNELSKTGQDGKAAALRLSELTKAARGASGSVADAADALGGLDQYGDIAFTLASAYSVLGDKTLAQLDEVDRMAYEQLTGLSGETFDIYREIANRVGADLKKKTGKDPTFKEITEEIAKGNLISKEEREKLTAAQEKSLPVMQKLGIDQIKETTNVNVTLKNVIAELLEKIYGSIEWITSWLGKDKEVLALQKEQDKKSEALRAETRALNDELSELRKKLGETTDDESRKKLGDQISKALEKKREVEENVRRQKAVAKGIAFGELEDKEDIAKFLRGLNAITGKGPTGPLDEQTSQIQKEILEGAGGAPKALKEFESSAGRAIYAVKDLTDTQIKSDEAMKTLKSSIEDLADGSSEASDEIKRIFGDEAGARILETKKLTAGDITGAGLKRGAQLQDFAQKTGLSIETPVNDFIYRGGARGGVITPINRKDEFIGMMSGGPVDKAGSMGNVVNINIEGGDEVKVYNVVRRVLMESGFRPNA